MKRSQEVLSPRTPVSSKIRIILALSLLTPCVGGAYAQKVGTKTGNPAPPAQGRKSAKPTGRKDAAKDRSAELSLEEQLALARLAAVGERAKGLGDDILKVK